MFKEIFTHFNDTEISINQDWSIKELSLWEKQQDVDEAKVEKIKAQSILKGSVGGVQALLEIQKSVSENITDRSAAIAIIQEIYGISQDIAELMLGTPKENINGSTTNLR
jgi:hypothetical protein